VYIFKFDVIYVPRKEFKEYEAEEERKKAAEKVIFDARMEELRHRDRTDPSYISWNKYRTEE